MDVNESSICRLPPLKDDHGDRTAGGRRWATAETPYQGAGVGGVGRVFLQISGQTEVGHFAHQVTVDQNVPSCQVPVNVVHLCQVPVIIVSEEVIS